MSSDELKVYDLTAWEVPEPPADLADRVIERMGNTNVGAVAAVEARAPGRRRAWAIAGAVAAALAVTVGAYALIRSARRDAPASGSVLATSARVLSLDGVRAELDPGADVRWSRRGGALHVEQRAGVAAWRVSGDDRLVIDAGAMGASVEATGASLRVEVQMNAMDGRVIGASALTAAAVAAITVIVYEGHVRVTGAGQQPVVVQPGSTIHVMPQRAEPDPVVSGKAAPDLPPPAPREDVTVEAGCDEVSCVLSNFEGACCAKLAPRRALVEALDRSSISSGIAAVRANITACGAASSAGGKVVVRVEVEPDGKVRRATVTRAHDPDVGSCVTGVIAGARFAATQRGGTFNYPFVFPGACDAAALKEKGMEHVNRGQHAAALQRFEASLQCKADDPYVTALAFMSSCNSGNAAKAKRYFSKLGADQQERLKVMCMRQRVPYE